MRPRTLPLDAIASGPNQCPFYGHCHPEESAPPDTDPAKATVASGLGARLAELESPVSFLDFETIGPALPIYVGTRPYQTIPFQWSLHVLDSAGRLTQREFLNDDAADPRERLIEALLDAVPPKGSIVSYSAYEKTVLNNLAGAFPRCADSLQSLIDRLYDLLPVARNYRHPGPEQLLPEKDAALPGPRLGLRRPGNTGRDAGLGELPTHD